MSAPFEKFQWKRKGPIPVHGEWWLRQLVQQIDGSYWMEFARYGAGPSKVYFVTIMSKDGVAKVHIAGRLQSMKEDRRDRVNALAAQAIAFVTLMGSGDDFPSVKRI